MKEIPQKVSESVRRINPHLYPLAGLPAKESQRTPAPALGRDHAEQKRCKIRLRIRVDLIAMRRRLLDSDNLVGSFKHVRDAIAAKIGIDDNDPRIEWHCHQIKTDGQQGTITRITL